VAFFQLFTQKLWLHFIVCLSRFFLLLANNDDIQHKMIKRRKRSRTKRLQGERRARRMSNLRRVKIRKNTLLWCGGGAKMRLLR
jgi:hypothetical protein